MKGQTRTVGKTLTVLFASAAIGWAQANTLSGSATSPPPARPGTVNYVEGEVLLEGQSLSRNSVGSAVLKTGQALTTANGYAELLLTPGAFLRVGHNSEIQLPTAGLASAQVQLERGSAILEVDQLISGTNLAVEVNGTTAQVDKPGLYSFNAANQIIQTFDGKLKVDRDGRTVELGKHDELQLASDTPLKKRRFDEDAGKRDPLYVWSKARSAEQAEASLRSAQNADYYVAAGPGWYWDPYFGGYGFWPLTATLYSPFGWGFYSPAYFGYYGFYRPVRGYYGYPVRYWRGRAGGTGTRAVIPRGAPRRVATPHVWAAPRASMPAPHFSAPGSRR